MLRSIQKLIGDKRKQLIFPIFLMSLDAIGSLVMYLMLYFTVIHLLNGSLTGGLVRNYTIVCLISIILRLIIYRSGYFLCFSRGAEMCSGLRLDLANHYRSLSLGYFNQNSSGYLLSTLTKDLSNFELVLTHTLPSIVKTLVMGCLILVGTFFINWKLALAECVVILIALPVLNWGNRLVEKYGTIKRDLTSKMISIVLEYIKGMKVFKSANMTSTHFTRMSDTLEDIRKTSVQAEVKTAAPTSMYSIIANFLLPFVLLIGSYLFLGGTIASELLVAFMLIRQLENRKKILENKQRNEERRVRTRRLIERGAILEGIFPLAPDLSGAEVKAFLIALSHLPGAAELTANLSKSGDTP